jgi:hypothetical protein
MTSFLQKYLPWITLALFAALIISLVRFPQATPRISLLLLVFSLGMAGFFIVQKQWARYQDGQVTGLRFTRNVLLEMLGLLLTMAAASYVGGMAGTRAGLSFGMGAGLAAAVVCGFFAAWLVRKIWEKASVQLRQFSEE